MKMKKVLKVVVLLGVFMSIAYWKIGNDTQETEALILQNVEALGSDETTDMNTYCYGIGTVDCPQSYMIVQYVIQGYSLD